MLLKLKSAAILISLNADNDDKIENKVELFYKEGKKINKTTTEPDAVDVINSQRVNLNVHELELKIIETSKFVVILYVSEWPLLN